MVRLVLVLVCVLALSAVLAERRPKSGRRLALQGKTLYRVSEKIEGYVGRPYLIRNIFCQRSLGVLSNRGLISIATPSDPKYLR